MSQSRTNDPIFPASSQRDHLECGKMLKQVSSIVFVVVAAVLVAASSCGPKECARSLIESLASRRFEEDELTVRMNMCFEVRPIKNDRFPGLFETAFCSSRPAAEFVGRHTDRGCALLSGNWEDFLPVSLEQRLDFFLASWNSIQDENVNEGDTNIYIRDLVSLLYYGENLRIIEDESSFDHLIPLESEDRKIAKAVFRPFKIEAIAGGVWAGEISLWSTCGTLRSFSFMTSSTGYIHLQEIGRAYGVGPMEKSPFVTRM